MNVYKSFGFLAMLCMAAVLSSGCSNNSPTTSDNAQVEPTSTAQAGDHSGWWCVEHAIPEEECSMCSAAAAKEFKEKGDWCVEHNRAESQCFICDASRAEKYAKLYQAKYGKEPPAAIE